MQTNTSPATALIETAPDFLKAALKCQSGRELDWHYFHAMSQADKEAMDRWLIAQKHPLAYQPGTNWNRFNLITRELSASN